MNWTGKKVFITGAGGFIGSHLAEALVEKGADVTAMARYRGQDSFGWLDESDKRKDMKLVRGDIADAHNMLRLIKGQEIVFHLAAQMSVPDSYARPEAYVSTNVMGTLNVLEASRDCERIIHTSTSEVYGTAQYTPMDEKHPINPQSPYAASKVAADALVNAYHKSYGLPVVTLRPFNTFGPRQSERAVIPSLICQKLRCGSAHVGNRRAVRDFNYVKDTAQAFIAVAKHGELGRVYNCASEVGVSVEEMADFLRVPITEDPTRRRPPDSEVEVLIGQADALRFDLGWEPREGAFTGATITEAWWERRGLPEQRAVA